MLQAEAARTRLPDPAAREQYNSVVLVTVAPDLQDIVRLGALTLAGLTVAAHASGMAAPLAEAEARVRAHPPEESAAGRAMFGRPGLDPTTRPPASQARLRRGRKGAGRPRINGLVGVCNRWSRELQLP